MKHHVAVKSMLSIAFYLVLIIAVWGVVGYVAFPRAEEDSLRSFVASNEKVLVQLAENALDPEQWPGVAGAPEVAQMLAEGGIARVDVEDGRAVFHLTSEMPEQSRAIVYFPGGDYAPPAECAGWAMIEPLRWQGGLGDQGYVNARALVGGFFYEEVYAPE